MHIGISRPPPPPHPIPDVDGGIIAKIAEELGFEAIFYGEHPITPVNAPGYSDHGAGVPFFQDTLVMMARASAMTSKIKIGSGVFLLPQHHPIRLAKHLASLDLYSGGRIIVGAGLGWSRLECEVLGGNFDKRWSQSRESIEIMKRLWSEETVEFHGEFYDFPPLQLFPKCATPSGPPILLPGPLQQMMADPRSSFEETPEVIRTFRRIVKHTDGWFPGFNGDEGMKNGPDVAVAGRKIMDRLCAEIGRNPKELQISGILRVAMQDGDLRPQPVVKREVVKRYEDVGVDRVLVTMQTVTNEKNAREMLERIAESVL